MWARWRGFKPRLPEGLYQQARWRGFKPRLPGVLYPYALRGTSTVGALCKRAHAN